MSGPSQRPLQVCVDARLESDAVGGVAQVIIGLAHGLSRLTDGDEQYHFLAYEGKESWVREYLSGPCQLMTVPAPPAPSSSRQLMRLPGVRAVWNRVSAAVGRRTFRVPKSDGTIERAGIDVMHFTFASGFLTGVPSIVQPHDIQHVHLPQFFSARARMTRDIQMKAMCDQASVVAVVSTWTKEDIQGYFKLPPEKVCVTPYAPVLESYPTPGAAELSAVVQKYSLPQRFVFYPARTFLHKNHLGLIEALALLRDREGLVVPFVSSGGQTDVYPRIMKRVKELKMENQVSLVGFVTPVELQCLYRLCRAAVIPSKFEAASFPVWEAMLAGAPVAASNVTSLPRQVGDAGLLFDPDRPEDIAQAVKRLWTDDALCRTVVERGRANISRFSWDRTARLFRAHYRRIAQRPLTAEDQELLSAPPLL